MVFWWVVVIIAALGVLALPTALVVAEVKPRLEKKKESKQLEARRVENMKNQEETLDKAVKLLAEHDVRAAQSNHSATKDIFYYLPGNWTKEDLNRNDLDYISKKYVEYTEQEAHRLTGKRVIEAGLSDFEELRLRRQEATRKLETAKEEIFLEMDRDKHEDDFALLDAEVNKLEAGR